MYHYGLHLRPSGLGAVPEGFTEVVSRDQFVEQSGYNFKHEEPLIRHGS